MMNASKRRFALTGMLFAVVGMGLLFIAITSLAAQQTNSPDAAPAKSSPSAPAIVCDPAKIGSPYIPVDSWVYPAMLRLYSLGYVDSVYLGLRPWTRASVKLMLEEAGDLIEDGEADGEPDTSQAREILNAINREMHDGTEGPCGLHQGSVRIESAYTVARAISGTPLDDSFHLGSTIVNDYGRPFENGFNNYSGASGYATAGRFALYVRGEFQGAPSGTGYSPALGFTLSQVDQIYTTNPNPPYQAEPILNPATGLPYPQATIPVGPIGTATQGRFLEAYLSYQYLNHVFSIGKQDQWLGPAQGASMAFSNNAQDFYTFEINRIEPLNVPVLSRLTGPFRYEFIVGALRGHTLIPDPGYPADPTLPNVINPGDPWVHVEKISFKPYKDLEFGFERTAIFGGEGHSPVTLHTFLRSFFSLTAPQAPVKNSRSDPGARFGAFDFNWRLPFVQKWITLYSDSVVHDDVSPIDAPRHASVRPGLYLSHVPGLPRLDVRVEGVSTDPPDPRSNGGQFMYWEGIEKQGYTNQGQLFGDWIGREDKGGQGWITYHLSGNEWIQVNARHQKADKDFIAGGTTLNDFGVQVIKRIGRDLEMNGNFTVERWKAPVYLPGEHTVTTTNIQLTWFPGRKISF
jgi:hypothetical protein